MPTLRTTPNNYDVVLTMDELMSAIREWNDLHEPIVVNGVVNHESMSLFQEHLHDLYIPGNIQHWTIRAGMHELFSSTHYHLRNLRKPSLPPSDDNGDEENQ